MNIRFSFFYSPIGLYPKPLFFFNSVYFLCYLYGGNFSVFRFTDSFLSLLHSAVKLIHWAFSFIYCGFSSKIFISFFTFSISSLKFFIFSFIPHVFMIPQSIFMMVGLKSLSNNSNICIILMSAFVARFFSFKLRFSWFFPWWWFLIKA